MPQHPSAFSVNVRDLIHKPGDYRDRTLEATLTDDWANAVIGVREGTLIDSDLRLESLHEGILVTTTVHTTATGECVRCLTELEHPVEVEIQELFAYDSDDSLEYAIHGDHVDLEPVIRDTVVLSLPFQPVCQEDCPGLCPQCGVRLLDEPGHEHEKPADPRWAALAGLAENTDTNAST